MKTILFVLSERGYTWDEVILPFVEFQKAGIAIQIATPLGKIPNADPLSIQVNFLFNVLGFGTSSANSPKSENGRELLKLMEHPMPLNKVQSTNFQAIYIAGGHGALFDLNKNNKLHELILDFNKEQKPLGLICHAVSTLAFIKKDGQLFLKSRNVTGFPTIWEEFILMIGYIHSTFLPLPIWTGKEIKRYASGRTLVTEIAEVFNPGYIVCDHNLITGVGPKAGGNLAKKLISLLS